jgi:hypothetical protein
MCDVVIDELTQEHRSASEMGNHFAAQASFFKFKSNDDFYAY